MGIIMGIKGMEIIMGLEITIIIIIMVIHSPQRATSKLPSHRRGRGYCALAI
jgi:hypothetical protein